MKMARLSMISATKQQSLCEENKSPLGERMMVEAIANGYLAKSGENNAKKAILSKTRKQNIHGFKTISE